MSEDTEKTETDAPEEPENGDRRGRRKKRKGGKKERVIHMRVDANLDDELRDRASSLGLSVSKLVRNVLQHTFGLVEDVIVDGANVGRAARGEPDVPRPAARPGGPFAPPVPPVPPVPPAQPAPQPQQPAVALSLDPLRIIGWQPLVLNMNTICARCNGVLTKGTQAALAVRDTPGPRAFVCVESLADLAAGQTLISGPGSCPKAKSGGDDERQSSQSE